MKKRIKIIARFILTLPQIIITLAKGVKIESFDDYERYSSFFRHFPLASISKEKIVSFFFEGKKVKMFCGESNPQILVGTFAMKDYDKLPNLNDRDILDIGAAIGDTAVYFGMKGARKIYSYEINERYYNICKKNIELNGLENIVKVELCGIGKDNKPLDGSLAMLGAILPEKDREAVNGVKMKTLNGIVNEHKIQDGILKIDVDGFEYEIMEEANCNTLKHFTHIIMEYHFGVKDLVKKLNKCGFKTDIEKITEVFVDYHPKEFQQMDIGYIYAVRA